MMPEFHETRRGQSFYDHHVPALVESFGRIAVSLETIAEQLTKPKPKREPKPKKEGNLPDLIIDEHHE